MVKEGDYMISDQEILGGLRAAIERGETLKDAMMTFYQAGYDKTEIEEAARAYLNQQKSEAQNINVAQRVQPGQKEMSKEEKLEEMNKPKERPEPKSMSEPESKSMPMMSKPEPKPMPIMPKPKSVSSELLNKKKEITPQKVSAYEMPKKKDQNPRKNNALTYILIFVLLFLFGILAAVYLFKDELIQFINGMFT